MGKRTLWEQEKNVVSDHFGLCHHAIGANLSPMAHEYITYGPKWPVRFWMAQSFTLTALK